MRSVIIADCEPSAPFKHRTDCRMLVLDVARWATLMGTAPRFSQHEAPDRDQALDVMYKLLSLWY